MSRWSPDQSSLMSLLDKVVGTQEMIDTRQDFCRLYDCLDSAKVNMYYTGSQAEGLKLPGSDRDFMEDMNNSFKVKVIQTLLETDDTNSYNVFLMCTESVPPGFALLQCVNTLPNCVLRFDCFQNLNGRLYFSSNTFVQILFYLFVTMGSANETYARQGPSLETWNEYMYIYDKSESGHDHVYSIHCPFWPNCVYEWAQRPRYLGWPSSHVVASIVNFGCHLVPVGHPHSDTKLLEWRISFSMAERALVWSFNLVQMQCYAVMKIILKEFIKVKCSPPNFVLCSYFIKTFLFWKFETTDFNFWRLENFRECIKFLLKEFSKCIGEGILRHYFIPSFNLLSVKLTREAQAELRQIIDMAIQCDIGILMECKTLRSAWSMFLSPTVNRSASRALSNMKRSNILLNDGCMITLFHQLSHHEKVCDANINLDALVRRIMSVSCITPMKTLLIKILLHLHYFKSSISLCPENNKVYYLHQITHSDALSVDIATGRLWYAFLLFSKKDYTSTLTTVNQVLSNIAPFALNVCSDSHLHRENIEAQRLYMDVFLASNETTEERSRKGWLLDFMVCKYMAHMMPLAIQIELHYRDATMQWLDLSVFTCAYYLMFLCYHELHRYNERDRALYQLVDATSNPMQCQLIRHHSYNIAGHCLLLTGRTTQARDFFITSYLNSKCYSPLDKYNSARHYLQYFFQTW